ncbi:MAG: hypothetical protein SYC29_02835 [Planctomycetota bacterium]|nr:hypothetical protein [Planctomycetota bacterium]
MSFRSAQRSAAAAAVVFMSVTASYATAGVALYYSTDEDDTHFMPTDAPEDPWNPVGDDGAVTITLDHREKIWFAARNDDDEGRDKYLGLRIIAPTAEDMSNLRSCTGPGDEDAEGFLNPDDSPVPRVRTVFGGAKQIGNRYAANYRMTPQPLWERFCFECISEDGIDGEFVIDLFTSCSNALDIPPLSAWFSMPDASLGAPGAMVGDPRYTELWLFPRTRPVDLDEAAMIVAPPETGPWFVEPVFADPDGNDRPSGGFLWLSDGAGLSTDHRFDLSFAMIEVADIKYDLFGYDIEGGRFDRLQVNAPTWGDNFDAYEPGPLLGLGGWEAWNDNPDAGDFIVTEEQAASEPHSVAIDGDDDAVRRLFGYGCGGEPNADCGDEIWLWSVKQYVPSALQGQQFFILLNTYEANGDQNWSLQLVADGGADAFADFDTGDALPLITDQWTEIRVVVDLSRDEQSVFYDGERLVTKSWTDGVTGDGALNIAALDLFGNGSDQPVYYDDLALEEIAPVGACVFDDDTCEELFRDVCEDLGGAYAGHGITCLQLDPCPPDFDDDGDVDTADLLFLLAAWGTVEGDVDGDGATGTADLLQLLANWGECP